MPTLTINGLDLSCDDIEYLTFWIVGCWKRDMQKVDSRISLPRGLIMSFHYEKLNDNNVRVNVEYLHPDKKWEG